MNHDNAFEVEEIVLTKATAFKGAAVAQQAKEFADRMERYLTHYDPVQDSFQLSDGEIYTTNRIIVENAEVFIAARKGAK